MLQSLKLKNRLLVRGTRSISLNNRVLIETHELDSLIKEQPEKLALFNATYSIGSIIPKEEHLKGRIPTSLYFDFNDFSHKEIKFSYTVPTDA
jgi:thiosulfate/3-mercaptopyruvate sulfurtransferase